MISSLAVLRSLGTLIKRDKSHSMERESMLFVRGHIPYLRDFSNSFSITFIDYYSCKSVSSSDMRKSEADKASCRFASSVAVDMKL